MSNKTVVVKEDVIDHVAKIQTTLTKPPSFRSDIEASINAQQNYHSKSVIQACVTSFEVPRGVKGSAIKRRLSGAGGESNVENKSPSCNSISHDLLDKNAMVVTEVTLPITFAAIVSVLLGKNGGSKVSLEFGASGTIQGTFRGSTSQCLLSEVHISLDTSSLVNSMIEQVKVTLRKTIRTKIPNSRLSFIGKKNTYNSILASRHSHTMDAVPSDNEKTRSERFCSTSNTFIENGQQVTGEAIMTQSNIAVCENNSKDKSNGKAPISATDFYSAQALTDLSNGPGTTKHFISTNNTTSKVTPSELMAFNDPTFGHLPTMRLYHPRLDPLTKFPNHSQDRKRSFSQTNTNSNDMTTEEIGDPSSKGQNKRMRNGTPQDPPTGRKGALRSTETGSVQDAGEGRTNGIEYDGATSEAWQWAELSQQDPNTYQSVRQRRRYMRRKSSGTLRTMGNTVEAVALAEMDAEQLYRRRKSSGTCGSLGAVIDACKFTDFDSLRRSTGGPNSSMADAAAVIRASELGTHRRNSNNADMVRFADMENIRHQSSGGPNSVLTAVAEGRHSDMDSTKRGNGVLDTEATRGSELNSHNDMMRYDMEALRRRSSGGQNAYAAAEAIRRVEIGSVRRGGGLNTSSMAAAAEAVRIVEMEAMARRRQNSGTVSLAAAAEAVRRAEMGAEPQTMAAAAEAVRMAEMEASYRRRSSGGANSSVATAAEAVRMAEFNALRRGSGGPNSSMSAAAEAVRMAEMNALRQGSEGPNSSMAAAAEAVRMAKMNAYRRRSSSGCPSVSTAAEAVRLEMDALRRSSGANTPMAAASEAVRKAEMEVFRRRSSGGGNNSMAAAEAVLWAEMDTLRRGSGGPNSSRAADIDAYRRRNSGGGNSSVMTEADAARFVGPNSSMVANIDAYRQRNSGGGNSSAMTDADAARFVGPNSSMAADIDAYRRRNSGGGNSSAMTDADAARFVGPNSSMAADIDAYRRRN